MKNDLVWHEDYVGLVLRRADGSTLEALVDRCDIESLRDVGLRWHAVWREEQKTFYARANLPGKHHGCIYLHRLLTRCPRGLIVDHENFNGLDCRRTNLRICGYSFNGLHQRRGHANKFGMRGVWYDKRGGRYRATVGLKGKRVYLGSFNTAELAGKAVVDALPKLMEGCRYA
jgi:hypothetical protein